MYNDCTIIVDIRIVADWWPLVLRRSPSALADLRCHTGVGATTVVVATTVAVRNERAASGKITMMGKAPAKALMAK
jgi:hypothetical protein